MRTGSPRCSSNMPIEALVSPLPSELTTPPVTKMCLLIKIAFPRKVPSNQRNHCKTAWHDGKGARQRGQAPFASGPEAGTDQVPPRSGGQALVVAQTLPAPFP